MPATGKPLSFLKRLYLRVQTTFISCGFVLVNVAFSRHAIEHRHCRRVGISGRCFIASSNSANHSLYMCTHHRTHTCVSSTSCFRLTGAFFGLEGIRQVSLLEELQMQQSSIVRAHSVVNRLQPISAANLTLIRSIQAVGAIISCAMLTPA